jgi:hypothetical protein
LPDDTWQGYRLAAIALVAGMSGMFAWLIWVNVPFLWAVGLVIAGFLFSLSLMRLIAETGLPLFFPDPGYVVALANMTPVAWRTAASMFYSGVMGVWFGPGQRSSVATVATHALGIDRKHKVRQHSVLGAVFIVVLVASIVGAGAVHLYMSYNRPEMARGRQMAWWGRLQLNGPTALLQEQLRGGGKQELAKPAPHLLFGGGMTVLLYSLCQLMPHWPLHPVGLLGAGTWCVARMWHNVFLGWLLKVLVLKYGGPDLYRKVSKAVIGVIVGEILALIGWNLFGAIRAAMGMAYHTTDILPK